VEAVGEQERIGAPAAAEQQCRHSGGHLAAGDFRHAAHAPPAAARHPAPGEAPRNEQCPGTGLNDVTLPIHAHSGRCEGKEEVERGGGCPRCCC